MRRIDMCLGKEYKTLNCHTPLKYSGHRWDGKALLNSSDGYTYAVVYQQVLCECSELLDTIVTTDKRVVKFNGEVWVEYTHTKPKELINIDGIDYIREVT